MEYDNEFTAEEHVMDIEMTGLILERGEQNSAHPIFFLHLNKKKPCKYGENITIII